MASVYILSDNGKLSKKDEKLIFTQYDGNTTILFPFKTESLVLMGNVSISGEALRLLTKYKITTTLLSSNGRFNGKLTFGDSKNVFLRQKQYRILDNPEESIKIAKSIVLGKIRNQISFMQRIKRKNDFYSNSVTDTIEKTKFILSKASESNNIEELRGHEGNAARKYFEIFGMNIQPEWAVFKTRSKNPPRSNVNAVLSFLYTLLMYRIESAIEAQGLDKCAGNLHVINYGRSALVFDLIEEFRSPIADTLCCSLFNLGTLKEEDFEQVEFSDTSDDNPIELTSNIPDSSDEKNKDNPSTKGILLTKPGLKKVIAAFETKMDSQVMYQPSGQKTAYKRIIYEQASHYKRVINGEESEYVSYYFK